MDHLSLVYAVYAAVGVGLTVWLARMLGASGEVFLEDVFPGQKSLRKPSIACSWWASTS